MQPNEHIRKIVKILIFAFLCTEMQTTFTQRGVAQKRGIGSDSAVSYQASIRLLADEKDYYGKGHICSGALVAPAVVISTSECVYNSNTKAYYHPSELRVIMGSSQRFAPSIDGIISGVTHIYEPPKDMAIAILMLDRDIPADHPQIKPISLVEAWSQPTNFGEVLVSTWGSDAKNRAVHELITLKSETHLDICRKIGICVYLNPSVQLEIGAPMLESNGKLAGLKSSEQKNMFINVASHVDWIQNMIGDGTNQNSSIWGIMGLIVFTGYVLVVSHKR
ncbi:uncharacterized protein [Drosophila tropicalis]|uniref:uncharacterized protein n=1 Tax=Drosophila tropicalis TaxID=46794 RepID=UPI0035AB7036